MATILRFIWLWVYRIPLNPWRCRECHKRGCSPIDYPDGATEWLCHRCGAHYWEDGEIIHTELELDSILMRKPNGGLE